MRLADTNLLVYAADKDSPHHVVSHRWLEDSLSNSQGLGLAWLSVIGFIRLTTHAKLSVTPRTVLQALSYVDDWLTHANCHILHPTIRHADILARLLLGVGTAGNLTNDAHLAALAIEHNAEIGTFDRDFKRFSGLKFQLLS
ncbi:MAG: type II toxin-antitoxin system VapC family toxin [Polaromonas sp.]|nr:type II toxin-antitoxin system VapC family toxin [Polaromonas sp.]